MDDALRRIERAGTPLERLRARRRAGWTERAAWEDLVGVDTSLDAVRDLAAEHPDLSREGDVFAHRPSGLRLRLVPGGAVAPLLVAETPWPEADPALLAAESVTVAVQVIGKTRGTIELPPDAPQEDVEAAALALPTVIAALAGKPIRKIIFVPNRIINVVA